MIHTHTMTHSDVAVAAGKVRKSDSHPAQVWVWYN